MDWSDARAVEDVGACDACGELDLACLLGAHDWLAAADVDVDGDLDADADAEADIEADADADAEA